MNIVIDRAEIIRSLVDRITAADANAVVEEGSPLYDLLVDRLADIITDERTLVNVLTNVARVVTMFGADGKLLSEYADFAEHITDRFFLNSPASSEIWDTLYLKFSSKGQIVIKQGGRVFHNGVYIPVSAAVIPSNSPLWKRVDGGFLHPVQINLAGSAAPVFIPATSAWSTGLVDYRAGSPDIVLIGAVSTKNFNTSVQPPLTLEYVRNSISNRSWSNIRSILYNLRSNTVFSPDLLIKARVMHASEAQLIERRQVLFEDSTHILDAIVSGDGKVLLDYGNRLNIAPVQLEYVPRTSDIYSEIARISIVNNPRDILRYIQLDGITGAVSTGGTLFGRLIYAYGVSTYDLTLELYRSAWTGTPSASDMVCSGTESIPVTGDGSDYRNIRMAMAEANSSGVTGRCGMTFDKDYFDIDGGTGVFTVTSDTFSLYRISTYGLGLKMPVAVGTLDEVTSLKESLESFEPGDMVPAYTRASGSYPSSALLPRGDTAGVVHSVDFAPADPGTAAIAWGGADQGRMYWRIITGTGAEKRFMVSLDSTFNDLSKQITSTVIPAGYVAMTPLSLAVDSNVFMTFTVTFSVGYAGIADNVTSGNYLAVPGVFERVSNNEVIYTASLRTGAANSADGEQVYLLYYGTDTEALTASQEAFLSLRNMEIGTRIITSPFRPVVFTCFYRPEYVSPYIADRDYSLVPGGDELAARLETRKGQFMDLTGYLENYFSGYSGSIQDIDFSELALAARNASGMTLRKLDYTVATQRGYLVRGSISIDLDASVSIVWTELIARIEEEVDDLYQTSSVYIHSGERESVVTDETMYKPMFSRIWL